MSGATLPQLVRVSSDLYQSADGRFRVVARAGESGNGWAVYDDRPGPQLIAGTDGDSVRVCWRLNLDDALAALAVYAGAIS